MLTAIYNYRQVTPDLATSGQPDEEELAAIAAAGYQVIINIALHDDPRYSLADEQGTVRRLGMRYVHIPVKFDAPSEEDLQCFFEAMDETSREKCWVHCAANKRVSVFLGLYRHLRQGHPVEQAFALQREILEPDVVWSAFMQRALGAAQARRRPQR